MQILQTAVAACLAWFLAVLLLGIDWPTFAPIAAVISLGLAVSERGRRAVELTLGVAFGVAIADLFVSFVGVGAVQSGVLVALAMVVAVFLGRGELGVNETAISAMIIMITFQTSGANLTIERFLEALIGGGSALLINALLPVSPERMVVEGAYPVFEESVTALEEVAAALDEGNVELAQDAYAKAQEIDRRVSSLKEAIAAGNDTARLAPSRRQSLGHLELYAAVADQIDLTVRDVRALARDAITVVEPGSRAPRPLPRAVRSVARATEALGRYLEVSGDPEDTRRFALEAARETSALLTEHEDLATNLATNALVNQVHSAAVDLLRSTGMDREAALQTVREVTRDIS